MWTLRNPAATRDLSRARGCSKGGGDVADLTDLISCSGTSSALRENISPRWSQSRDGPCGPARLGRAGRAHARWSLHSLKRRPMGTHHRGSNGRSILSCGIAVTTRRHSHRRGRSFRRTAEEGRTVQAAHELSNEPWTTFTRSTARLRSEQLLLDYRMNASRCGKAGWQNKAYRPSADMSHRDFVFRARSPGRD